MKKLRKYIEVFFRLCLLIGGEVFVVFLSTIGRFDKLMPAITATIFLLANFYGVIVVLTEWKKEGILK